MPIPIGMGGHVTRDRVGGGSDSEETDILEVHGAYSSSL